MSAPQDLHTNLVFVHGGEQSRFYKDHPAWLAADSAATHTANDTFRGAAAHGRAKGLELRDWASIL